MATIFRKLSMGGRGRYRFEVRCSKFEVLGSMFEVSKTSNSRTSHIERIYQGDAQDTKEIVFHRRDG